MHNSTIRCKRFPLDQSGLATITDIIKAGKYISQAGGWMKDFVYSIKAPTFKSLN